MDGAKIIEQEIKDRCSRLLKESGIDQNAFAKHIGAERSAVAHYWTGRTIVPIRYWKELCDLLKISIDYLVTGKENPIVEAYYAMNEDDRKVVNKFMGLLTTPPPKDLKKTDAA